MKNLKIIKGSGIIDFHINKKKYNAYKTDRGKRNYVYGELNSVLNKFKGETLNDVEIRLLDITSNDFWVQKELCFVNDIGYSAANKVPLNEDVLTARIFSINLIGICKDQFEDQFPIFRKKGVEINISCLQII
jgi:hypothetical protein